MARADCRTARALAATAALTVACVSTASAQSRVHPYIGASLGSISVDSDDVDGRSATTGVVAGLTLTRYVDVEFEAVFPTGSFTRRYVGVVLYAPPQGTPREDVERYGIISDSEWRRDVLAVLSGGAIIHPAATGRVVPALVAGITAQRARRIHRSIPLVIPAAVDPQHPAAVTREERIIETVTAPTIGGQLSIRVAPRLYVVPDVRYDYGSSGDEINNSLRASVRGVWKF